MQRLLSWARVYMRACDVPSHGQLGMPLPLVLMTTPSSSSSTSADKGAVACVFTKSVWQRCTCVGNIQVCCCWW